MNLLKWIGLMPIREHQELAQEYGALKRAHDGRLDELVAVREQLDRARRTIDTVATSRAEVAEMLRHAMDEVTNAVGLARVLDAAKLKLELDTGAERPVGGENSGGPEDIHSTSVDPRSGQCS